jgi:hypothetical protein
VEISIAIEDLLAGDGRDTVAGDHNTRKVHSVGSGYRDDSEAVAGAGGAKGFDSFSKSILFAAEAGEEAAATDFATGF